MPDVPPIRLRMLNDQGVNADGQFVLYWMIAFRRPTWNFSLQRAVELAQIHRKPLVVLEPLRCNYRWASDRLHQFIIDGMLENARAFEQSPVTYYPYIEETDGAGRGLLEELSKDAVAIVTDDFPCFFLPPMTAAVAKRCGVLIEAVDSNGIYPMRETDRAFTRAHHFRRHLQKSILPYLQDMPLADPMAGVKLPRRDPLPTIIRQRWPAADLNSWQTGKRSLAELPIDHHVGVSPICQGGSTVGQRVWQEFLNDKLVCYQQRNQPDRNHTSGLSPYLHFGHIAVHEIVANLIDQQNWTAEQIATKPNGSVHGWWQMSEPAEAFLDQVITWRELGFNLCSHVDGYTQYDSLPTWAQATLREHASDPREHGYTIGEFETAATHDRLWNAAQTQLVREGTMHNYLRMLWGKKILEWSANPREAWAIMIELNNKYALDGRDPNSYSGISWILGRYDRAWGPERPVFGKIRYMSSANTARKLHVRQYLERYAPDEA